mmetsp:Transcript_29560/g.35151  ORF Transcript_29560/g.35151 Transcript_29560/m.35151 type:complete len:511 (-) Transcript_29560:225-1757(-)|eukprot:CAMPEP_0198248822 /NCGR_PEP_ID=MMETSP1447-20131203/495_1 /TAXON_ID=420782 /ORGANISM="Chaetoceros dichaeta, Strain CCMP1751" /LENGTH=510 /DNA_ID=CAMNT_0043933303 /DNA_START=70 /DNA_END=1602 /DNA_ORIENTATION=+
MTNYYRRNVLAFVLAIATSAPSSIEAARVSSKLQVRLPKDLSSDRDNGFEHREALFGVPPYGGAIQSLLQHANNDLCSGPLDRNTLSSPGQPFILMVDRGSCTFVQKVRNAQHSGAVAVIIADNTCQCKHVKDGCQLEEGTLCEEREPLMADDGSGTDITVPTMLMFKQDADPIKAALDKGAPVRMEMSWSVPNPDDHVEYDLWSTVTDSKSNTFQKMWMDAQLKLGGSAAFTPHYYIYDGVKARCRDGNGVNLCYTLCTNEGRYCAIDPDNDLDYGISGANVVEETLRRLCIWDIYGNDGTGPELFQYVREFDVCDNEQEFTNEKCISDAMARAGVEITHVNKCVAKSGGTADNKENTRLQAQMEEVENNGIIVLPVAYVNGVPIRGTLDFDVIFKAVCAGYKDGTTPDICTKCSDCHDSSADSEYRCVVDDKCEAKAAAGVSNQAFSGSLIAVILFFGLLAFWQHRKSQSQMRTEVKGIMAEYMPITKEGNGIDTALEQDDDEQFTLS